MAVEDIIVGRDPEDIKKYGSKGCVFIGKHVVGIGFESHLTNPILMDMMRPHVILINGKRGSGKCVEENTLITLEDGSLVPIKDLKNIKKKVFGLNSKLKITPVDRDDYFVREVDKIIHLKLRSGREIKITPEHPLLTIKGWRQVNELSIGSRIAVPRKIEVFGNKSIEEYKIKLLAYLLGEGHLSNGFVLFSNKDREIYEDFLHAIYEFDNNLIVKNHSHDNCYRIIKSKREIDKTKMKLCFDKNGNFTKGTICPNKKSSIREWLDKIKVYGKLSKNKFIPDIIFQLPKKQLSLFLNRLFSCDGSIYKSKKGSDYYWEISYSSSSKKMINQIHHLLLRFGILSKIRNKKIKYNGKSFNSFELIIGTANIPLFIKEIGFYGEKARKQELCLKEIKNILTNPNIDTIPKEIWDVYRPDNWAEVGRVFGYKVPKAIRSSINYSPSIQKLLQIAEIDNNKIIKLLALSDIFWDEIVSMELLEGKFRVCDISVPEFHNFVANDIIVHNSYTGAVLAEELMQLPDDLRKNLSCLLIDTMGIFWSMKTPNDRDLELLRNWNLKPKGFNVINAVPIGLTEFYDKNDIPYDIVFAIKPSDLSANDWALTFNINIFDPLGILLERVIRKLEGIDYNIEDIINEIQKDERSDNKVKMALENRFLAAQGWGIFSKKATTISELLKPGIATVLDVSLQEWNIRNLMLAVLAREIYQARVAARRKEEKALIEGEDIKKIPMTWIIMDEAHQFLPNDTITAASKDLLTLVTQGRQPGISCVFITQRPNKLHETAISQADLVISHRLTSKPDLDALSSIMQTYLLEDIRKSIADLPKTKGTAIILDDNSERLFKIQIRPRLSWHAGASPIALKEKE
ncbi:MAG: hypothetical protein J7K26_00895 [Candidatus Aenigmarchaeota archaeon]|nr:hypothetical protein [Candidatus Aenigmarchaeota archaeon]